MDPDALLARIREIVTRCMKRRGDSLAFELGSAVGDLDEWLLKGGHLPSDWEIGERDSNLMHDRSGDPDYSEREPQFGEDDLGDMSEGRSAVNPGRDDGHFTVASPPGRYMPARIHPTPARGCGCECDSGGFCGGCGHAGCGRR